MSELSPATKKLIAQYSLAKRVEKPEEGIPTIHVDEVASRVAAFYEHIRTVVEWKEEHLMRRAAIIRKLKRRFFEMDSGNEEQINQAAEGLVLELIRGGHFPNDTIPESNIGDVKAIIKKYLLLLRQNPENRQGKAGLQFYNWLLDVAACEIEDKLAPAIREKALIEYMFWMMKDRVIVSERVFQEKLLRPGDADIQLYIAVCHALSRLDTPIISYNLLKYKYPTWEEADSLLIAEVAKNIFKIYQEIQADLANPLSHKFYAICERYDTPFLLMGDILFNNDPDQLNAELIDPRLLEQKIKDAYERRLSSLQNKMNRAAAYLTASIFLTKILSLLALGWIIDMVTGNGINGGVLMADILIPTSLMFLIVMSIKKPSKKNINTVLLETMRLAYSKDTTDTYEIKLNKKKNIATRTFLSFLYALSAVVTLGGIFFVLHTLGFPITSILIDIVFIALILSAGTAVKRRAQELTMEPEKESVLSFLADIFLLPMQLFGKWLSNIWRQYNGIAAIFNALIDMPFTAFVEFIEGWRYFIKERKEEIR